VRLLRASSEAVGLAVALEATVGRSADAGIEHADVITAFGEAITRGDEHMDAARDALREAMGEEALMEAAGIVGIFNGLVRTADFSGIPLDDDTLHGSQDFRESLGLNGFGGAANTDLERADPTRSASRLLVPPSD
jgi:hypothetical protein